MTLMSHFCEGCGQTFHDENSLFLHHCITTSATPTMTIDPNHDIVPTLRMFDGVMMNKAADEIERLRALVASMQASCDKPVAFEFYSPATGHAIVDYTEHTHVGHLTADGGYVKRPLVYAEQSK